eukprot:9190226-Pyramimonas_sp.AAC.1
MALILFAGSTLELRAGVKNGPRYRACVSEPLGAAAAPRRELWGALGSASCLLAFLFEPILSTSRSRNLPFSLGLQGPIYVEGGPTNTFFRRSSANFSGPKCTRGAPG